MRAPELLVRRRAELLTALLAGTLYALCSVLVTAATSFGATAGSTFWPGAGVTLAFLLRSERHAWTGILLAVGLAELVVDIAFGFSPQLAIGWAVANTAEAWLGAHLLRRHDERPRRTVAPLPAFLLAAVVAGPVLGATTGTLWAALVAGDDIWPRLARWFVGDAIGVLVVAPVIVHAVERRGSARLGGRGRGVLVLLGAAAVLGVGPWEFTARWGLPFLVLALVLLASVRLDPRRAAWSSLVVALTVETVTALDAGPFSDSGPFQGLVVAQMFVAACSLSALVVSSLTADLVSRDALAEALRVQAQQDPLTGVGNRRLLEARYPRACATALQEGGEVGVLVVDLDKFKAVNDEFGHDAGDLVLVETARRLQEAVRDGDTVVRIGGDEFVVLLEGVDSAEDAEGLARRARAAASQPVRWGEHVLAVRGSVGVATARPGDRSLDALLRLGDAAMYLQKRDALPAPRRPIPGMGQAPVL